MSDRRSTVWVDAGGRTRACLLTTSAGAGAVETALAAASNAVVQASWEGPLTVVAAPAPVAATYADVADYAQLLYEDAGGEVVAVTLPAPLASCFLADQETIDPAAAPIAALTAAVLAAVVTASGAHPIKLLGGSRYRARR